VSDNDETTPDVEPGEGVETDGSIENDEVTESDKPTESDEDSTEADSDPNSETPPRRVRAIPAVALALVLGLLAAGGLAGWVYFAQYRPDKQTDHAVEQSAVNAARDGTVALLSYKPDTLNQDFAAAKSHLGGDFRNYYEQFTKDVITPAAQSKGVTTAAQVVGAAATELHRDSAVVLVFVNQATASKERPDPSMASSSILVSLARQHGDWLITKFDPI
jgi:Mce-associated membrane protein